MIGDREFICSDLQATRDFAQRLAGYLKPGDVVLLDGALAAGKTTFTGFLVQALGSRDPVSSPTYALCNIYDAGDLQIYHIDAYRLASPEEFYLLGVEEFFPEALAIIEWGARLGSYFPEALQIHISGYGDSPEGRAFRLSGHSAKWSALLEPSDDTGATS